MLDYDEGMRVADQFGVAYEQVRRDHLISYLLAVLGAELVDQLVFIGGTALARTHLPDGRLSEDVDLLAMGPRRDVVDEVQRVLMAAAVREYGRLRWDPPLTTVRGADHGVLHTSDGLVVRVQLLPAADYPPWPIEERGLLQRYSDAPAARLRVPTLPAFAASKTGTWADRRSARDLYDLWGLAAHGAISPEAARLYVRFGPTGDAPRDRLFRDPPSEAEWRIQLSGQTRIAVGPREAANIVAAAWSAAVRELEEETGP